MHLLKINLFYSKQNTVCLMILVIFLFPCSQYAKASFTQTFWTVFWPLITMTLYSPPSSHLNPPISLAIMYNCGRAKCHCMRERVVILDAVTPFRHLCRL